MKKVSLKTKTRNFLDNKVYILFGILLLVVIVGAIAVPQIFQIRNIFNVLRAGSVIGIVAIGATLVLLTGEIDLSVGSIMSLSLVIGGLTLGYGSTVAFLITCITGMALGAINGIVVAKGKVSSLMATLGALSVYGGLAILITRGQASYLYGATFYLWLGRASIFGIPIPIIFFVLLIIIGSLLLTYTPTGKRTYYVGANEKAAITSGIKADKIKILMFTLGGLCAALAGPILGSWTNRITPTIGRGYELSALTIAVLGGTLLTGGKGSLAGTFIAAVVFSFLLNILTLSGIGTYMTELLRGLLLIFIVAIYSKAEKSKF